MPTLSPASHRIIQSAVHKGGEGEHVKGILFLDDPPYSRSMSGCVPENAEQALHQIHQASVFTSLRFCLPSVEYQQWRQRTMGSKCLIN
jgi:hypothetical protein